MPTIHEVTKELTQAALDEASHQYFSGNEVKAKFIRIGDLILFAPLIECESIPGQRDNVPEHISIIMGGFQNADAVLAAKVGNSSDAEYENPSAQHLDRDTGIIDAGTLTYTPGKLLEITDKSISFGRADESGRRLTASIAQSAMSEQVRVENSPAP
jgi:hypothetical protein